MLEFRLRSMTDGDARAIEATRTDAVIYLARPGPERKASLPRPIVYGPPVAVLMDLPMLSEDLPAHRPYAAVYAAPWYGKTAFYRSATLDGFTLLDMVGRPARIGTLASDFPSGPTARFDLANALTLDLLAGTLASVTDLELFAGANAVAIESTPGTWEIVQFGTAELIGARRYRCRRLLRGQFGTEGAIGDPALAGARVVVLDAAVVPLSIGEAEIGIPFNWRIGPARRPPAESAYLGMAFTPAGVGLRPYAVGHVAQPYKRARVPGDLEIAWTRRTRARAGDSWKGDAPLFEEAEAYEVDILDGAAVKRTLATATATVVYTAAQQTADWGTLLGPGDALGVIVYQISAAYGRGAPKAATLYF